VDPAPLILTLALDEASFQRFDAERRAHFPPERNFIPAHVTLFHHLPGEEIEAVRAEIAAACAAAEAPLRVEATGLRFLGRGVAYALASRELEALRADLARRFDAHLTPQDRQRFRPHMTIQNKADPAKARALFERMEAAFAPFSATGEGLLLWRYRGGPWEAAGRFGFGGRSIPG